MILNSVRAANNDIVRELGELRDELRKIYRREKVIVDLPDGGQRTYLIPEIISGPYPVRFNHLELTNEERRLLLTITGLHDRIQIANQMFIYWYEDDDY